jgi:PAS domain S-box-containing protein
MSEQPPIDFASLFARSPNPYMVLDRDLTIEWTNDAYLKAVMRRREDVVGRRLFDAFPSDPESESFRLLHESLARVLRTGQSDEIALIRYDIANHAGDMETRYWSATHTPVVDAEGAPSYVLQHTVDVTELQGLRRLRDEVGLVQRADAIQAQNLGLAEERDRFRRMFEQAPGFVTVIGGPDHVFLMANAAYRQLMGGREIIGKTVAEAVPEAIDQGFVKLLDHVRSEGVPYFGDREALSLRIEGSDTLRRRYLTFIYQPIYDKGEVAAIFVQGHDVTEEVEASEAQSLLINELNHRVKNTLSIVQGLASQSFRKLDGAPDAIEAFNARLTALAAAHSLLTARSWEDAAVEDTICEAISATLGDCHTRVQLNGPALSLPPQTTVSLAMLIHELSTNALKYGSLSVPDGHVTVDWTVSDEGNAPMLTIEWQEIGGPVVEEPTRRGFGTRLIQRGLSAEGASSVTLAFDREGLRCTVVTRIEELA